MSSRDLRADRRLEVGLTLLADGRPAAAAKAIEAALEIDDGYAEAWFALAEARAKAGHRRRAAAAYRRYLALQPDDALGAGLRLALLGAAAAPGRPPEAYLRRLFDQYAPRFERALRQRLGYDAPELLAEAVAAVTPADAAPRRVLDLGCGTGLCGPLFRERAVWLEGVDLSPGMLGLARARKVYDALVAEEAERYLATVVRTGEAAGSGEGAARTPFDLIVAADVLVYLGDLAPLFRAAASALRPGGLFAFTLERDESEAFRLQPSQRYAHHPASVAALAAAAGFETLQLAPVSCRLEAGRPVPGLLVLLRRPGPALQDPAALPASGSRGRPRA
ncbi:Predicted methyltransferase, contains TPR repeat [Tistlia consotensis]|uniref:Predicted methyltransferase, contains TPR repeat n=1 Tax=Tistlia consotensis USBA 355 TaxID=560819 RepID=A0A1Y6B6P9_9PROT|nr:methyltransferase domain-containing protein [Tistlia consotensis]SME88115.1 Predicted methyltransferase, contains TPR repeat [Tistlia consotensis USBA 355]SNR24474.1 Predicted methyltransferase, contains TPR repeat [Tistlia consotensis]